MGIIYCDKTSYDNHCCITTECMSIYYHFRRDYERSGFRKLVVNNGFVEIFVIILLDYTWLTFYTRFIATITVNIKELPYKPVYLPGNKCKSFPIVMFRSLTLANILFSL